jgi:hypothetical protein
MDQASRGQTCVVVSDISMNGEPKDFGIEGFLEQRKGSASNG